MILAESLKERRRCSSCAFTPRLRRRGRELEVLLGGDRPGSYSDQPTTTAGKN
jgi:hypothetical protein